MTLLEEIVALNMPLDDHGAVAAALSVNRTKIISLQIGIGTILGVMAPVGGLFLNTLRDIAAIQPATEESANVEWTLELIKAGTFDIGLPVTRYQLSEFASKQPLLADKIEALLDLAVVEDRITSQMVTMALGGS